MADKESSPECFICTESEPTHRSACLCTDRYMHTDCFVKMLKAQKGEPKCGVRHATEQNVRAAFSCNSPFLYTFHMTPGMLQQLVDQLDDVQPSSVIGHFCRQRDTGPACGSRTTTSPCAGTTTAACTPSRTQPSASPC